MIYLDTSLIVSLYSLDANSEKAVELLQAINEPLLISTLCEVETINAFGLKEFRKEITSQQAAASLANFDRAVREGVFLLRALPESSFARARKLSLQQTPRLGTRTADLLHVAAALELGAAQFFSFDVQQKRMAEAAGLKINP